MNEEVKDDIRELEPKSEQSSASDNNESEDNMMPIYTKLMARLSLVSTGLMIFVFAFYKATQISGFDTTKLLLFELCLLILFVFVIGIVISLALMRHDRKANRIVAVQIYVSALLIMVVLLLIWVFFKANPVEIIRG